GCIAPAGPIGRPGHQNRIVTDRASTREGEGFMSEPRRVRVKATASLPEFEAVLPMTRRAQIASSLRNIILSGQLTPGPQLVESKLASRFGVSRGSIREAIRELVDEGLLINRPYAGTFVVDLDEKMLIELFSLRVALEQFCFTQL